MSTRALTGDIELTVADVLAAHAVARRIGSTGMTKLQRKLARASTGGVTVVSSCEAVLLIRALAVVVRLDRSSRVTANK